MNATADYLRQIAHELAALAAAAGLRTAAHLFEMVVIDLSREIAREADRIERAKGA
ncbi:hypothetical protein [Rhodoplanes serenus]|uniref:hypothetical protein n=1 Tax=Rhodoplanes serenus TaxID=200615 RepID=UPI00131D9260|nr:hypothetical protein [Rhodoplanes serenus]